MSKPFQKFVTPAAPRPYATAEAAAARLIAIAQTLRVDNGWMPVGKWNETFLWTDKASVAEYSLGRDRLIADGVIVMHECGGFFMWANGAPPADDA